jgi:hypothetical protein
MPPSSNQATARWAAGVVRAVAHEEATAERAKAAIDDRINVALVLCVSIMHRTLGTY